MKILMVRLSALGDIVLTTGLLRYIKRCRPDIHIDFVTQDSMIPLIKSSGAVENTFGLPAHAKLEELKKLAEKTLSYDHIFDLHGVTRSRRLCALIDGSTHRLQKNSLARRVYVKTRFLKNHLSKHVIEKYADVTLPILGLDRPDLESLRPFLPPPQDDNLGELIPQSVENFIAVHPYASQKNKEWPYFSKLINLFIDKGQTPIVFGRGSGKWPDGALDLSNKTTISQMQSIVARAQAVVTTDSGPLHLSLAYSKPTYSIFGPTTKELGFFPLFKSSYIFENANLPCRPCHVHGGNICPKIHFRCMKEISAQSVADGVLKNLD